MLNRAWLTRTDLRIARLEGMAKNSPQVPSELERIQSMQAQLDALQARIEQLESKAHEHKVGRPPKAP